MAVIVRFIDRRGDTRSVEFETEYLASIFMDGLGQHRPPERAGRERFLGVREPDAHPNPYGFDSPGIAGGS